MPFEASARCSSGLTPAPIIARASSNATGGTSCRARIALSVSTRSGAVSTSVPSRSKTMVGAGMGQALARVRGKAGKASGVATPIFNGLAAAGPARYWQAPSQSASCRIP